MFGASNLHIVLDGTWIARVIVREWRLHRHAARSSSKAFAVPAPIYASVPAQAMAAAASHSESCAELT